MIPTKQDCLALVPEVRDLVARRNALAVKEQRLREDLPETAPVHIAFKRVSLANQVVSTIVLNLGHHPEVLKQLEDLLDSTTVDWIFDMCGDVTGFASMRELTEQDAVDAELAEVVELMPLARQLIERAEELMSALPTN